MDPAQHPDAAGLRVAILSDAAPERNGVGAYYRDLADHLRGAGARVTLLAPRYWRGRWHGGLTLPLPGDPTQRLVFPSPSKLWRRLQRLRPNVVVVPTPGPYGLLGVLLAGRSRADLVVGFHTDFSRLTDLFQNWQVRGRVYQRYVRASNRLLFNRSTVVLANSDHMVKVARELGARRVNLMATPIPRRFLATAPAPLSREFRRVLFAGRLAPEKNLELVVDAARQLPGMDFLVAGDGPLRPWLEGESRSLPNLTVLGWVRRSQVMTLIDSVDALILPSKVESFGTIALEAMARGRVVLVSSACGILSWRLLNRGLFPIRENEHLADALIRVRDLEPGIRAHKARAARAGAEEISRRNLQHWLTVLAGDHGQSIDADC